MTKPGTLYLIPTPIGEGRPEDILPLQTLKTTKSLRFFVVENLRSARRFLSAVGMDVPIGELEFSELNEHTHIAQIDPLLKPLLDGHDCGLVSEAGVPAVADPGADLVAACHRKGIRVVPLTGPSSILMAVMASGLNGQSFAFNGYLPIKAPERIKALKILEKRARNDNQSQLFIEAPYRNLKLFEDILSHCFPATRLALAAGIQTDKEFIITMTVEDWKRHPKPEINKIPTVFILL